MKDEYSIAVDIGWVETVKAGSEQEAIKKLEKKYKYGKGYIPREYIEVTCESDRFVRES